MQGASRRRVGGGGLGRCAVRRSLAVASLLGAALLLWLPGLRAALWPWPPPPARRPGDFDLDARFIHRGVAAAAAAAAAARAARSASAAW